MRFHLLLCTVFLLKVDPSLLTWLCSSLLAGFASVWWSFPALVLSLSLSEARLLLARDSATSYLATELRSARGRASACSGPCYESSSWPSVLTFAFVELLHSFQRDLDLSLKLFDIMSTRSLQGVPGTFSLVELETPISACIRAEITLSAYK